LESFVGNDEFHFIAAKDADHDSLTRESADLLYHLIVLLVERKVRLQDIRDELVQRRSKGAKES